MDTEYTKTPTATAAVDATITAPSKYRSAVTTTLYVVYTYLDDKTICLGTTKCYLLSMTVRVM